MIARFAFALLSLHPGGVLHHGAPTTWWTTDRSTATFDAHSGDTINVFLTYPPERARCDDYGGTYHPLLHLCEDVDF